MNGIYHVKIQNELMKYEFDIKRNITILKGDSATGKTTLIEMIREFIELGEDSGIQLDCDAECRVISGNLWKEQLAACKKCLVFIDEGNKFIKSKEFAEAIKLSDNYYILVTRECPETLPVSVDEIYGIRSSGKYGGLTPVYHQFYRIFEFNQKNRYPLSVEKIVTEDSNSGYEFFSDVAAKNNIVCQSAGGKSNIYSLLSANNRDDKILVIADGAAFGTQMTRMESLIKYMPNVYLYLPESFEWLVLCSGIIKISELNKHLYETYFYADSTEYFSWEQYYTALLIKETQNTYLSYSKNHINENYISDNVEKKILKNINITFLVSYRAGGRD